MTARVEKLGGSWVIVRGCDSDADQDSVGATGEAVREFWTGDGWALQYGFAKQFWTREEAESYFAQNARDLS
jgi:hypothetical protein